MSETLNGLHNDKNNRREKLAGGLPNLLAAAVELSSVKIRMKIYEVGKCPIMRATFSFSLSRNIGTLLVETFYCEYCQVRDQPEFVEGTNFAVLDFSTNSGPTRLATKYTVANLPNPAGMIGQSWRRPSSRHSKMAAALFLSSSFSLCYLFLLLLVF